MTDLVIRDEEITQRLLEIARRENRPVESVLASLLAQYDDLEADDEEPKPGTFAALAASARRAGLASEKPVDTSEHAREIMKAEYADYVRRHADEQSDSD